MIKLLYFFVFFSLITGCSLNKNSKFWTESKKITQEDLKFKEIFPVEEALNQQLNPDLKIIFEKNLYTKDEEKYFLNNDGRLNFDINLKKSSRYNFSKIKNFEEYEPKMVFNKKNIIFFDNKGSILKFNEDSKLIWKKNYYSKLEKNLTPILQLSATDKFLIVADNIAKYYMINIENGDLIWTKNNLAPFNSQIKIYKDKFFIIDFFNTLRCFSIKSGDELWNIKTENSLVRSQKKLSMIIENEKLYFNNSIGDINAVDIERGELLWQLPTQDSLIYESAFSLKTSELVSDKKSLFFSNNKNQFFSVDLDSGSFNWENKINSNLKPSIVGDFLFTVSLEGYLVVIDKKTGNIIRITDVFNNFKPKKRKKIKPIGFIVGMNNIYLSTNIGTLLIINTSTGKTISSYKIDNEKISRPFHSYKNLFVIKNSSIIKLN